MLTHTAMAGDLLVNGDKAELRRTLRTLRSRLSLADRTRASAALSARAAPLLGLRPAEPVALYSALQDEVDPAPLAALAAAAGARAVYPRVTGDSLTFAPPGAPPGFVRAGAFGILEPTGPAVPLEVIRVFIVPGLGFDRRGTRLGYGRGYYDRALAQALGAGGATLKVGLCFAALLADALPRAPHDVAMDLVVTENEVIYPARAAIVAAP